MSPTERTFGRAIAMARKAKGLSQKELATMIIKEDGTAISPQYLNDIEHDRRSPKSDHLILQFAHVLEEDEGPGYLFVRAGRLPEKMRQTRASKAKVLEIFDYLERELSKA